MQRSTKLAAGQDCVLPLLVDNPLRSWELAVAELAQAVRRWNHLESYWRP